MIGMVSPSDVERFSDAITRHLGLQFEEAKQGFLAEVLQRRLEATNRSLAAYLRGLESQPADAELRALARELTVNETYFFRNVEQFHALAEVVLPERMRARGPDRYLRILSAACASGEEAYSIAVTARETIADPSWRISIKGVDFNSAVIEKAQRARYSTWSLRETGPEDRAKWFRQDGRELVLDESVRKSVDFEVRNLAVDDDEFWRPEVYDVVFCRNALMYFSPDQARATLARIARSLAPGGFLFLGHAETLRNLSDDFHLRHTHGAFYYERKDEIGRPPVQEVYVAPRPVAAPAAAARVDSFGAAWFDAIRDASERVEALSARNAARPSYRPATPGWDLGPALDLMRHERFSDALDQVSDLPVESERDPDTLLLRAMLLTHNSQFAAAEAVCRRLLEIDELNAGAHYALALCSEGVADREGAAEHDRVAVYLDPAFAMPRLHLGLLARHAGDKAAARRELAQALVLLKREDASRLLLFAGGFNREALIVLCRSALLACGGQP